MGSFLFLLLFAAVNVALGWATANWLARNQELLLEPHNDETAPEANPAQQSGNSPSVQGIPSDDAAPPESAAPATGSIEPESETAEPSPASVKEESTPAEPKDSTQLDYDQFVDHVTQECEFAKATSQVLKLNVDELRSSVLAAENVYRAADAYGETELVSTLEDIKGALTDWLPTQQSAADQLADPTVTDSFTERAATIHGLLNTASTRLHTSGQRLLDSKTDNVLEDSGRIRRELGGLMDACHNLRDVVQEGFATVVQENRQSPCNTAFHVDESTGLANIVGLEAAIAEWWESKEQAGDAAALVVLDVDGMAQLNQQIGTNACDQLLSHIAEILRAAFRQDRGFDVAAKVSGQRFAGLMGYTTARQGANALERVRQTIAGLEIVAPEGKFNVRISTAGTALQKNVSLAKHMDWLTQSLEFAKERGGNCTVIWRDDEPIFVEPVEYDIPNSVLNLVPDDSPVSETLDTATTQSAVNAPVAAKETSSEQTGDEPHDAQNAASVDSTEPVVPPEEKVEQPEAKLEEAAAEETAHSESNAQEQQANPSPAVADNSPAESLTSAKSQVIEVSEDTTPTDAAIAESEEPETNVQPDVEQPNVDLSAPADEAPEEGSQHEVIEDEHMSAVLDAAIVLTEELESNVQSDVEQLIADSMAATSLNEAANDEEAEVLADDTASTQKDEATSVEPTVIEDAGTTTVIEDEKVAASIEAAIAESEQLEGSIQSDVEQLLIDAGALPSDADEPAKMPAAAAPDESADLPGTSEPGEAKSESAQIG